jgi:hypothetical protein
LEGWPSLLMVQICLILSADSNSMVRADMCISLRKEIAFDASDRCHRSWSRASPKTVVSCEIGRARPSH